MLFIPPLSTISQSFLYYFPCQISTIVSETLILLSKWVMCYFTSHPDTILWVSLILLCESHIYSCVNDYYFIVQFIYLRMYPATLILLSQSLCYYFTHHSHTILPVVFILLCQLHLYHCQPFIYYCRNHSFTIVEVTLIILHQSILCYFSSHTYTIASMTRILLYKSLIYYCYCRFYTIVLINLIIFLSVALKQFCCSHFHYCDSDS